MDGIGEIDTLCENMDEVAANSINNTGERTLLHEISERDKVIDQDSVTLNLNSDVIEVPRAGMEFNSVDEAFAYYIDYGNQVGFPVLKRSGKNCSKKGVRYEAFICARGGKPNLKKEKSMETSLSGKIDCKARIRLKIYDDGKVVVTSISLEHNHHLSPSKSRYFRRNRKISSPVKRRLVLNDQAGIPMAKNFNALVVEHGGYEKLTFLEKDCRNCVEEARRLRLGVGDGEAICNYFSRMQKRNSNFFYAIDLDDENRLKNIFWADARSRAAYKSFGDVVTFDTTYLTNKYDMPFAPFVGVNHHGHSILFGCGLLSNENHETFEWLFKQWLICMSEKAPDVIITDQDPAMKIAIQAIFPSTTRHRWCLWHIRKKIPEKLSSYSQYESIKGDLANIVYDSESKCDFESKWAAMMDNMI
jgi:hypothetical protein